MNVVAIAKVRSPAMSGARCDPQFNADRFDSLYRRYKGGTR
jgi:hypothetical protein